MRLPWLARAALAQNFLRDLQAADRALARMALNAWLAGAVHVLHAAFALFMVWAPFSGNKTALVAHALVTPFLWVHWALNDDTCALTLLEKRLRGCDDGASFVYHLVSPVYKVEDAAVRAWCWAASAVLWLASVAQLSWSDVARALRPPA